MKTIIVISEEMNNVIIANLHSGTKLLGWLRPCSLSVEFHYGFKLLRYVYRFQTLTISDTVSHNFVPPSCERNP